MQILFGPSHDARHIEPDAPNGYEWWYFDAISDDGQFALVVIFFLGTPMSPYYKTVVDGKNPLPKDWCGVFVSLHERKQGKPWHERAYAYNLYRNGEFATATPSAKIGGSTMRAEVVDGQWCWHLTLDEPGLWRGRTQAEITFTLLGEPLAVPPVPEPNADAISDHHWACVAPRCRVEGIVTPAHGQPVTFGGTGYHDHNFGMLPWRDAAFWFWARIQLKKSPQRTAVFYHLEPTDKKQKPQSIVLFFSESGTLLAGPAGTMTPVHKPTRNAYGFRHDGAWQWQAANGANGWVGMFEDRWLFSEGPFYRRFPVLSCPNLLNRPLRPNPSITGVGIGEVFQPSRLCGPIASRAMWTRMRRRS